MTDKPKNFSEACERIVAQLAAKDAEIARLQAELERARKVVAPSNPRPFNTQRPLGFASSEHDGRYPIAPHSPYHAVNEMGILCPSIFISPASAI